MPGLNIHEFQTRMEPLAHAWSEQDPESALDCFTPDAATIEPPNIQIYQGQEQLRPSFAARTDKTWQWRIGNFR